MRKQKKESLNKATNITRKKCYFTR